MPRKGNVPKRDVLPDPKFNDKVIAKLINKLTSDGKKSKAEKIIYGALESVEEKTKTESMKVFKKPLRT
jgi:small subunit ribosomal protein S7